MTLIMQIACCLYLFWNITVGLICTMVIYCALLSALYEYNKELG